jgi:HlyD family secretion protein
MVTGPLMRAPTALAVLAALALVGGGYLYWNSQMTARVPTGLASANGRIEVERVDIAAKLAGRVAEIRVKEGDFVQQGAIIAQMDTAELRAQLAAAKASVQRAVAAIARAEAEIAIREAEHNLSELEVRRAKELEQRSAGTKAELERRTAQHLVAEAQILGARAALADAKASKEVAEAQVAQIEATLQDMTLWTPVAGRVEYKLVQPGEVVAPGGRLITILDLTDVFMTIFLPTGDAGRVALGSEARIVLDAAPKYVFPTTISFVAAEAQFTPKAVETASEREKLMYRVKLKADPKLLETYRDYVKAGLTATAYVQVARDAAWPDYLAIRLPDVPK